MLASVENTSLGVKVLYSRRSSGGQVARALGFVPARALGLVLVFPRWVSCGVVGAGGSRASVRSLGLVPVFPRWAACQCFRAGPRVGVLALSNECAAEVAQKRVEGSGGECNIFGWVEVKEYFPRGQPI
ncbi:hypothetical protein CAURIC_04700 [Corynebacterium auriscanis]|nr:hypothetical protein CAURIC_04700 [Corynebacterium auriscanis]